ncbi:MAG: hypothetical protein Q4Q53_07620 [Methanocorpusculum sp.]|nr:hypothetical protein [Methanocorpusculum sp.]
MPPDDYERCVSALKTLCDNPFPGSGGDKEKLKGNDNRYRIHIGRTYSAIYKIDKEKKRVCVTAFGTIGDIHKKY